MATGEAGDSAARDARVRRVVGGIARGDHRAFEEFYGEWFDRVLRMATTATGRDEAFGMDVVQEVMVKLIDRTPRVEGEAQLGAWLRRAVLWSAIDRIRRDERVLARERRASDGVSGSSMDAAAGVSEGEQLRWLESELAKLPAIERDLLRRRFGAGASLEGAGEGLGMTGDAAHGRIRRAIDGLRLRAKEFFR